MFCSLTGVSCIVPGPRLGVEPAPFLSVEVEPGKRGGYTFELLKTPQCPPKGAQKKKEDLVKERERDFVIGNQHPPSPRGMGGTVS